MNKKIHALPPFQQQAALHAYVGLHVCWEALFYNLYEDTAYKSKHNLKAWVICLTHYDPSIPDAKVTVMCRGISLEKYPEFKSMHKNELVIVSGTVRDVNAWQVLISEARFEFTGRRIG